MAISRAKTWSNGEVLSHTDLNAEFDNIINNATSLVSPLTGNLAAGGFNITGLGTTTLGWNLIDTKTASASATIDFTSGLSTNYNNYAIKISNLTPVTDNTTLYMRVSQSTVFLSGATDYGWLAHAWGVISIDQTSVSASTAQIAIAGGLINTSGRVLEATITFGHPAETNGYKNFMHDSTYSVTGTDELSRNVGVGRFQKNTTPIDGIRFLMSSGNISVGTFSLYGLRKV